ncbi:MAG: hypothetical protein IJJ21_03950 [Firmicutes bacterium]|nr:hypothetical protein [Bacillota bacterium]
MKRNIMKKTTALLLSLAMLLSLTPQVSFAAKYETGDSNTKDSNTKIVESGEDLSLQFIDESVQEILYDLPLTEDYYSREIIDSFNSKYQELIDYVKEHPDEIVYEGGWLMMGEDVFSRLSTLEMLAGLPKNVYNGEKDLQALKDTISKKYNTIVKQVHKADYNSWYWDKYVMLRNEAKARINAISDLDTYTYACEADFYTIMSYYLEDEDDMWIIILFDDEVTNAIEEYLYDNDLGYDSIITKEEIKEAIHEGQKELNGLLKKAKKEKIFTPSKSLQKKMKGFTKKASGIEDLMVIADYYRTILDEYDEAYDKAFQEQAGPDESEKLSYADRIRWDDQMVKYVYAKDHNDYSPKGNKRLISVYYEYSGQLDRCNTQNEAQKVWDNFVKAIAKVPTLKKELRQTKAKYIKSWKKTYIGKKAYNQKKARKTYKAGVKALGKASTLKDLKAAYEKFTKKLDQTIYRYRVSVSKSGKGTVSGSKLVKHGDKYQLRITPSPGHSLKSVTVNGKSQKLKYSYSIKIMKATKIKVVFR